MAYDSDGLISLFPVLHFQHCAVRGVNSCCMSHLRWQQRWRLHQQRHRQVTLSHRLTKVSEICQKLIRISGKIEGKKGRGQAALFASTLRILVRGNDRRRQRSFSWTDGHQACPWVLELCWVSQAELFYCLCGAGVTDSQEPG